MKKRALSLLFASTVAAACLTCGCSGESNSSIIILGDGTATAYKTALTVYGHRTDRHSLGVMEDSLQGFMAANSDISASYESAAETNYWQALDRRISTNNLNDVFMTDRDRLTEMTGKGVLAELTDAVNVGSFNDFARSQLYTDGKIFSVPAAVTTYGLYVNYDVLEKNGKQVPRNLSDFTAVCDYFVSNGVTPVICNNHSSLRSLILARGMYGTYSQSGADGAIATFNANPAALAAVLNDGVDLVYNMIQKGWIDTEDTALCGQGSDDLQRFAAGVSPFMITGGWASSALKEILESNGKSISYGIYAYPVLDSGSVLVAQADCLLSVKKGDNENDAKRLVSALTSPETLLKFNDGQSCFSPLKGQTQIYSDAAIIPSASYLTKGKYVIGSDNNLAYPLDSYLTQCGTKILNGETAQTVKAYLLDLLTKEVSGR